MAGAGVSGRQSFLFQDGTDLDRRHCQRVVPMKVLVLGLCRTGTLSVRSALKQLGYIDTYHMRSASTETPRDCEMWMDALRAKYDGVGTFGKEDWDALLGHCQAVCDFPAAAFAPELIEAYPNAKVILTCRDVDSWHDSTTKTIYANINSTEFVIASRLDWAFRLYQPMLLKLWYNFFEGDFPGRGREVYRKHYESVRCLVPPERLLEYRVQDGWGPLCKFLGEDVPREEEFPTSNTIEMFVVGAKARNRAKILRVAKRLALVVLALLLVLNSGVVHRAFTGHILGFSAIWTESG